MSALDKTAWRSRLRAQRKEVHRASPALLGADLAHAGLSWLESLGLQPRSGSAVCVYISIGDEPPTEALLGALTRVGYSVYVPVCEPGHLLSWVLWFADVQMARSRFAPVMEPVGPRNHFSELDSIQAIFVPALAVDRSGVRLGQGGGYYDRFLATAAAIPVAAVVYAPEVLASGRLPSDVLDAPVDYSLTPVGYQHMGTGTVQPQ